MITKATVFLPSQTLLLVKGGNWEQNNKIEKIVWEDDRLVIQFEAGGGVSFNKLPCIVEWTEEAVRE